LDNPSQAVVDHPVLYKITGLKQTLDGLGPIDEKLKRFFEKRGKRKESDDEGEWVKEGEDDEEGENDIEGGDDDDMEYVEEELSEDDEDGDSGLLTKTEQYQLKEESKQALAEKLRKLKKEDDSELLEIVKGSSHSKKEAKAKAEQELKTKEDAEREAQ
jgi:Sas10 C-terminal domain